MVTSAKEGSNVNEAFDMLTNKMRKIFTPPIPKSQSIVSLVPPHEEFSTKVCIWIRFYYKINNLIYENTLHIYIYIYIYNIERKKNKVKEK